MDEKPRPKSRLAPALIVAGVLAAILTCYGAGYLSLSDKLPNASGGIARLFRSRWQAWAFVPAAVVEAKVSRIEVELNSYRSGDAECGEGDIPTWHAFP
jgi:hypothetical protein